MPCESCSVQFSVFKRKRFCSECARYYCSGCLRRGGGVMCGPCRLLSTRPLVRLALSHLKVRDLQYFLNRQNVSTRGCVEKEDLINLVLIHVNSGGYRKKQSQQFRNSSEFPNPFSTFKGFTNNINNLFNSAFDIGSSSMPNGNSTTVHQEQTGQSREGAPRVYVNVLPTFCTPSTSGQTRSSSQFETSGEAGSSQWTLPPEIVVTTGTAASWDSPVDSTHLETDDCLEIEDVDDAAEWEFVRRPAEPLPPDSSILITENPNEVSLLGRASSEPDLRHSESNASITDTSSLTTEEPPCPTYLPPCPPLDPNKRVNLEDVKSLEQLMNLNVKQLKELLFGNRVDFKGCCEREELLDRAQRLWKESTKSREDLNELNEDLCKICMDAPVECVMLECGHIATCTGCGKRLSECPICRQYVVRVVRFFRS